MAKGFTFLPDTVYPISAHFYRIDLSLNAPLSGDRTNDRAPGTMYRPSACRLSDVKTRTYTLKRIEMTYFCCFHCSSLHFSLVYLVRSVHALKFCIVAKR